MCWSATADVVAGGGVSAAGVACLVSVRRGRDVPLAALPLLLGTHQLIESVVWRGVHAQVSPAAAAVARTAWASIALPVLPAFLPLAIMVAAGGPWPRRQWALVAVGLLTAAPLAYDVATGPVTAHARGDTLQYGVGVPLLPLLMIGYLLGTLGAFLASPDRRIRTIGGWLTAGAVICSIVWWLSFASTWCAYAAVVSVLVFRWVRRPAEVPVARVSVG